jgi:hypothetical protein
MVEQVDDGADHHNAAEEIQEALRILAAGISGESTRRSDERR